VGGDRIIVVGGQNDGGLVNETEASDCPRWRDVAMLPTPREHLAVASRFVYAVGGRALSSDRSTGALERYDPAGDRWSRLRDKPTPRHGIGVVSVNISVFAIDGARRPSPSTTLEALTLR
jgi:hypothetical protein